MVVNTSEVLEDVSSSKGELVGDMLSWPVNFHPLVFVLKLIAQYLACQLPPRGVINVFSVSG